MAQDKGYFPNTPRNNYDRQITTGMGGFSNPMGHFLNELGDFYRKIKDNFYRNLKESFFLEHRQPIIGWVENHYPPECPYGPPTLPICKKRVTKGKRKLR
ncbi:MAG: hypothetical protein JW727_03335 [Candidatus Aenigmarchaeota archaeon]|nr:hypothetical protein [Candidatus Aenigmarchaeota archaeon]